jgi:hypothetical protein
VRCLDIDYYIMAGYVVVGIGAAGILTAVSQPGLARFVIIATLLAALFDVIENAAIRQAVRTHPSARQHRTDRHRGCGAEVRPARRGSRRVPAVAVSHVVRLTPGQPSS